LSELQQVDDSAFVSSERDLRLTIGPNIFRFLVPADPALLNRLPELEVRHLFRWLNGGMDVPAPVLVLLDNVQNAETLAIAPVCVPIHGPIQPFYEALEFSGADFVREIDPRFIDFGGLFEGQRD